MEGLDSWGGGLPGYVGSGKWPLAVLAALDTLSLGEWNTRDCKLLILQGHGDDPGSCQVTGGLIRGLWQGCLGV